MHQAGPTFVPYLLHAEDSRVLAVFPGNTRSNKRSSIPILYCLFPRTCTTEHLLPTGWNPFYGPCGTNTNTQHAKNSHQLTVLPNNRRVLWRLGGFQHIFLTMSPSFTGGLPMTVNPTRCGEPLDAAVSIGRANSTATTFYRDFARLLNCHRCVFVCCTLQTGNF